MSRLYQLGKLTIRIISIGIPNQTGEDARIGYASNLDDAFARPGHTRPREPMPTSFTSCLHGIRRALPASLALLLPAITPAADTLRDCDTCPPLTVVAAGSVTVTTQVAGQAPVTRTLALARPLAVGTFEVSRGEFAQFVARTGYSAGDAWQAQANTDPQEAVTGINQRAVRAYVRWLARYTGKAYRLPTRDEWEYAARGGTTTNYWWGNERADGCGKEALQPTFFIDIAYGEECQQIREQPGPRGSFPANPFGLHDILGNAGEWVANCDKPDATCPALVSRGDLNWDTGHAGEGSMPLLVQEPRMGFRVVRDLP